MALKVEMKPERWPEKNGELKMKELITIIVLLLSVGCGKNEGNRANQGYGHYDPSICYRDPSCVNNPQHPNNPQNPINHGRQGGPPGNIQAAVQQILARTQCSSGQRWQQMSFVANGGVLNQAGHHPSGGVWYAGVSALGDVILIQEIPSGVSVGSHNVILSFCTEQNPYSQVYTIGPGTQLSGFRLSRVRLAQSSQCSIKNVGYAEISMQSSNSRFPIVINFARLPGC